MFNGPEEGVVQSHVDLRDLTHIGPSMHSFMSLNKVKSVVFYF
jgi:hypothetical protein